MRRLILFDIDGTLVLGGPAKEAFHEAMIEAFGTVGAIEGHSFSGKTDPQIARELLAASGLSHGEIDRGLPLLWRAYLRELEARLPDDPMTVLPAVEPLLDALEASEEAALGLLTGNIVDGARLKLGSAGLFHRFRVGSFGSDHEERNRLPAIAIRRARDAFGVAFRKEDVVVVGDTPRDVECARHEGTLAVAVATGHHDVETLEATGADRVFRNFRHTDEVVEALLGG